MKKRVTIFISILISLNLIACGDKKEKVENSNEGDISVEDNIIDNNEEEGNKKEKNEIKAIETDDTWREEYSREDISKVYDVKLEKIQEVFNDNGFEARCIDVDDGKISHSKDLMYADLNSDLDKVRKLIYGYHYGYESNEAEIVISEMIVYSEDVKNGKKQFKLEDTPVAKISNILSNMKERDFSKENELINNTIKNIGVDEDTFAYTNEVNGLYERVTVTDTYIEYLLTTGKKELK